MSLLTYLSLSIKPEACVLTVDRMIISLSPPWKASTVETCTPLISLFSPALKHKISQTNIHIQEYELVHNQIVKQNVQGMPQSEATATHETRKETFKKTCSSAQSDQSSLSVCSSFWSLVTHKVAS